VAVANLEISRVCAQRCRFCFTPRQAASPQPGSSSRPAPFLPVETFDDRLAFLDRSGIDEVRFIGGEPTLHPHFPELVARAGDRHVVVFSSGLMRESALDCLTGLPPQRCTVLVNADATRHVGGPVPTERRRRACAVHRLGPRALLGVTITRPDVVLESLLDLVEAAGARPAVRLGLAAPILAGTNDHLPTATYPAVGDLVAQFAARAARHGVRLQFDCGFVPCMFTPQALESLRATADLGWRCNPVLDIGMNGVVSHCFPLAGAVDLPFTPGTDAPDLRRRFGAATAGYRRAGIRQVCSRCPLKHDGDCPGGCLAVTLRRFRRRSGKGDHHDA
jgi:hypothetical protein